MDRLPAPRGPISGQLLQALADQLAQIAESPRLRERLGAAAREHVVELLGWDRWTEATVAALEHAAGT